MKFGVALGALNPHFHLDATLAAEELGYESVWLPEHLVFTRAMSSRRIRARTHPPVPPDTPIYDAFAYLAFLAARTERVRLGTHVYNIGLRHPFTAARGVQTLDIALGRPLRVRDRRVVARRGVGRDAARLRDPRPAGRRGDRDLQAAVDRADGHAPRRVLRVRRGRVRAEAGAAAVAADPRRRRVEGRAPARGAARRRLDRHGAHVRVGGGADRDAARRCSPSTGREPTCRSRSCSAVRSSRVDDVERWEDLGVTR